MRTFHTPESRAVVEQIVGGCVPRPETEWVVPSGSDDALEAFLTCLIGVVGVVQEVHAHLPDGEPWMLIHPRDYSLIRMFDREHLNIVSERDLLKIGVMGHYVDATAIGVRNRRTWSCTRADV